MTGQTMLGGIFTLPATSRAVNRMGGAMQLAGRNGNKLVWGPPRDVDGANRPSARVVACGVDHIDTADFYGPHVTNQIIRKALSPYPDDLVIVTKVSARRGKDGSWIPAFSREESSACRTSTTARSAPTMLSSPILPGKASRTLARYGAETVLACRNLEKGRHRRGAYPSGNPGGQTSLYVA